MRKLRTRIVDGIEVEESSGNVFADLGLPDAEALNVKASLIFQITRAIRHLGLTQGAAAQRMGLTQPKVSNLLRGDFANVSERKLMDCLNRLGYDIAIRMKPAAGRPGRLTVAIAEADWPPGALDEAQPSRRIHAG